MLPERVEILKEPCSMLIFNSITEIGQSTTGMSPCEEGMSPYFAKFKKFPLSEKGSKRFRCETSVNMSAYIVLGKQIDGDRIFFFCC